MIRSRKDIPTERIKTEVDDYQVSLSVFLCIKPCILFF